MLINLYIINDYLSFQPGKHLLSSPVTRDLEKPVIPGSERLEEGVLYVVAPDVLPEKEELSGNIRLFFTAPPTQDPKLEKIDYLYSPVPMDPVELLQELYGIFQKFHMWELSLHRAMLEEDTLRALGDCSVDFLRNPVGLYTSSFFNLMNWERKREETKSFFQKDDKGSYVSLERANVMLMTSEFIHSWSTSGPCFLAPIDGYQYTYLYQNINLHGSNFARVVLNDYDFPYRDSDLPILDFFTQFITKTLEADRSPHLTAHPPFLDEALLKLASGEKYDAEALETAFLSFGWSPDDLYMCARVIAPQDQTIGSVGHACMRLETMFKGCCVLHDNTDILMLINLSTAGLSREQAISSLHYLQREYMMKISYSYEFQGIENLHLYCVQANVAFELGQKYDPHIWSYRFETYALSYALRNSLEKLNAMNLCHPGLIKLLEYDREKGRNFAHTLRVYLENNMSVTQSMRKEYLQRASFQYRLQKIQEIMNVNLDNYETRLHILLSFQWLDMESEEKQTTTPF